MMFDPALQSYVSILKKAPLLKNFLKNVLSIPKWYLDFMVVCNLNYKSHGIEQKNLSILILRSSWGF